MLGAISLPVGAQVGEGKPPVENLPHDPGPAQAYYSRVYPAYSHGSSLREGLLRFTDIGEHWAGPAIIRQVALGLLDSPAGNRFGPQVAVSRLDVLKALVRLRGLEQNALRAALEGDTLGGYVRVAQGAGIISPREAVELSWSGGARRQEVAAWLARTLRIPPAEAWQVRNFGDWPQIEAEYTGEVEALLTQGHLRGVAPGLLAPNQVMRRGEFASLVDRAGAQLLPARGITTGRGRIIDGEDYSLFVGEKGVSIYYVLDDGGVIIAFQAGDPRSPGPEGLVVSRAGHIGGADLLRVGDRINYYLAQDEVLLIEVTAELPQYFQGKIIDLDRDKGWLDFSTLQGERNRFSLDPASRVSLNGSPARLEDLRPGQEVDLEVLGGLMTEVSAFLPEGVGGYIVPGSRVRSGHIRYLGGDKLILLRKGERETYRLTAQTQIVRGGKGVPADSLLPGEMVTLYFDDLDGDIPTRIQAPGERQKMHRIFRGIVNVVSPRSRELIISQPAYFDMVGWEPATAPLRLEVHPQTEIYDQGQKITFEELGHGYLGREIYAVVPRGYGRNETTKIIVKSGYGKKHHGRIRKVDRVAQGIELDSTYFKYDPGTIFLWDDRFIDPYALERGQEVMVLASVSGKGTGQALLISVEDVEEPGLDIYQGLLKTIGYNHVRLGDISSLSSHRWRDWSSGRTLSLRLNLDTLFWDNLETAVGYGPMTKGEFDQKRLVGGYRDCGALLISRRDEVLALGIWPGSVGTTRVTVGRIRDLDPETGIVRLERAKDWNVATRKWRFHPGTLEVEVGEAVVVRDTRGTSCGELRPGDNVYLLREGMGCRLIIVY